MKKKFIILTTAITRPDLHKETINLFYREYVDKYREYVEYHYELYHIINIDSPKVLEYSVEKTIENFNEIIDPYVKRYYIESENPSFSQAFENIMKKLEELELLDPSYIYFWFEDDWKCSRQYNFFEIVNTYLQFECCAMTMTQNAQLGSFRGGPIMNGRFFLDHFNLVHLGVYNVYKDPERQVCRWIGKYGHFFKRKVHQKIKLLNICLKGIRKYMDDFGGYFYLQRFHKSIVYEKYIYLPSEYKLMECTENKNHEMMDIRKYRQIENIVNEIKNEERSIVYITIKPYNFEDIGRKYALEHGLHTFKENAS